MTTYSSQTDETTGIDNYIRADDPTTNNSTSDVILVGRYNETAQVDRALLKFDLSSIPALALVTSATLTLTIAYKYSNSEVAVYRLKRAWSESQSNWNVYSTGNSWETAGATGANDYDSTAIGTGTPSSSDAGTELSISLTPALVQTLINGTFTNNGFLIMATSEGDYTVNGFASSAHATSTYRPKLTIEYLYGGNVIIWSS